MIVFRLTHKLARKINCDDILYECELCENPFLEWSANLFRVGRTGYIILTNTASLYSMIMYSRGITDNDAFIGESLGLMRVFMEADGFGEHFHKYIEPEQNKVLFAKSLNRSVLGSMNDFITLAKDYFRREEASIFDAAIKLNETPMSYLKNKYSTLHPKEAFMQMRWE